MQSVQFATPIQHFKKIFCRSKKFVLAKNMEEICQQIRSNKLDREYYKNKCATINNLGRKKWSGDEENPLLVAVECNRVDLVDFLIHLGVHVNSLQQNHNNQTKV